MLLSPKQIEFVRCANHRWNFKGGATRSGKTYLDFKWIIPMRIRERIGKDGLSVILGVTKSTIERNVLEPMRNIYGDDLVGTISSDNTAQIFGEKCYCLGAEKISQVSKLRGTSFKYCYGDEVADWSEEVFVLLKSRLDKDYSCFDGTFNPQYPGHWLKQFLDSKADIFSQTYTIDDNPFLPETFKENLKKEYEGTVFYDRYILGRWVAAQGAVYRDFADNPDRYLIDDPDSYLAKTNQRPALLMIGVDFGGNNSATTFKAVVITSRFQEVIVVDEHHIGEQINPQQLNERFSDFVQTVTAKWGGTQVRADSAEQILIRGLRYQALKDKLKAEIKNAIKMKINNRIRLENILMAQDRLKVCRKCKHMIEAFRFAVYNPKKANDERLDDGTSDIDSLDAFEYAIEPYYNELTKAGFTRR